MNFFDKIKDAFSNEDEKTAEAAKQADEARSAEEATQNDAAVAAANAAAAAEAEQKHRDEDAARVAEQERAVADAQAAEQAAANQAAEQAAAAQAAAAAAAKPTLSVNEVRQIVEADSLPSTPTGYASNAAVGNVLEQALAAAIGDHGNIIDGSLGTSFQSAYSAWQESLGYSGADADGMPGKASLQALADRTGMFNVTD